jgi:hypothetical protein
MAFKKVEKKLTRIFNVKTEPLHKAKKPHVRIYGVTTDHGDYRTAVLHVWSKEGKPVMAHLGRLKGGSPEERAQTMMAIRDLKARGIPIFGGAKKRKVSRKLSKPHKLKMIRRMKVKRKTTRRTIKKTSRR